MEQEYIYRAQNIVHNYYNQTVFIELGFFLIRLELMWNRNVCIHLFAIYLQPTQYKMTHTEYNSGSFPIAE